MNTNFINYIISGFVIVISLVWGYFLIFFKDFLPNLSTTQRTIFAGLLLGYAVFRSYRLYQLYKKNKSNQH